jgi:hypothetical protein
VLIGGALLLGLDALRFVEYVGWNWEKLGFTK